jgi:serine/threonine protein kinase
MGPYDLLEKIGQGSVSTVFKGRHRETGQLVAVKVVLPPYSTHAVVRQRLEQEFHTSNTLHHPHIVRALDFGRQGSACYLALELVDGPDLGGYIAHKGPLPEVEAVRLIRQVAKGLHHIHKHGLIHRDVKPRNILLTPDGQAKLADLGLIKNLEDDLGLTSPNMTLGTPSFIAPEQLRDAKSAGVQSDVYALGATLYLAVTGQRPFPARQLARLLEQKLANDLVPPRQLVPTLSVRVEGAILRALRAEQQLRPRSCPEFVKALTQEPPDQLVRRARKHATRRGRKTPRTPSAAQERRATVRYACAFDVTCHDEASAHTTGSAPGSWRGTVRDVSRKGIGLLLPQRIDLGTVLKVQDSSGRPLEVRVRRVEQIGRGRWLVGAVFVQPLSWDELRALL